MHQVRRVRQVAVVQLQTHRALVTVAVDVVDALSVEARRSSDNAVHFVSLLSKRERQASGGAGRGSEELDYRLER